MGKQLVITVSIKHGDVIEESDITADVSDLDKVEVLTLTQSALNVIGSAVYRRFKDVTLGEETDLLDFLKEIGNGRRTDERSEP